LREERPELARPALVAVGDIQDDREIAIWKTPFDRLLP
jgi:hypothetical protein